MTIPLIIAAVVVVIIIFMMLTSPAGTYDCSSAFCEAAGLDYMIIRVGGLSITGARKCAVIYGRGEDVETEVFWLRGGVLGTYSVKFDGDDALWPDAHLVYYPMKKKIVVKDGETVYAIAYYSAELEDLDRE